MVKYLKCIKFHHFEIEKLCWNEKYLYFCNVFFMVLDY